MIGNALFYGWKNMKHRQLRSWLTIIGVIIGIAAIVSLITIGQGLENAIIEQFSVLGADRIRVVPEGLTGPPAGVSGLTNDDVETVRDTIGVDFAGGIIMNFGLIEYNNEETTVFVKGIDAELAQDDKLDVNVNLESGDWFSEGESKAAVIGNSLANNVFDKEIYVKNSIIIEGEKYKVVGIMEAIGEQGVDQIVYMSMDDAEDLFDVDDEVNAIFAAVEEGIDMSEVAESMDENLERDRDDDNFVVFTPDDILTQLGSILDVVRFILAGIAAISLFVGGIGIMNSMYTSVLERTKQIGVMKAVGASRLNIMTIFMLEAGLIGSAGGLIGVLLGNGFAYSVQGIAELLGFGLLKVEIMWNVALLGLVFAFVVGMISGLYPAYRASRLQPVEALRYE